MQVLFLEGRITGKGVAIDLLVQRLSSKWAMVVDRTGLTGRYDFTLKCTPASSLHARRGWETQTDSGPSFFRPRANACLKQPQRVRLTFSLSTKSTSPRELAELFATKPKKVSSTCSGNKAAGSTPTSNPPPHPPQPKPPPNSGPHSQARRKKRVFNKAEASLASTS